MRVLCVGDSLGLPREECPYECTWFYKLKCEFPGFEFVDFFERRLHANKALSNFDSYYAFYPSDIVIIQTGICDCAPRYINEERMIIRVILSLFRKFGMINLFWKVVKLRGRKPSCVDTPMDVFTDSFCKLITKFIYNGVKFIILVKIGHATDSVMVKNKHINDNIDKYNREIGRFKEINPKLITVVDPLEDVDESLFVDGYHCNAKGMEVVFKSLKMELEKFSQDV